MFQSEQKQDYFKGNRMSETQIKFIKEKLEEIAKMNLYELDQFAQKLYIAKLDMERSVFNWLRAGVDSRLKKLDEQYDAIMCDGEIKVEELR